MLLSERRPDSCHILLHERSQHDHICFGFVAPEQTGHEVNALSEGEHPIRYDELVQLSSEYRACRTFLVEIDSEIDDFVGGGLDEIRPTAPGPSDRAELVDVPGKYLCIFDLIKTYDCIVDLLDVWKTLLRSL
jgi:hypothetical protein